MSQDERRKTDRLRSINFVDCVVVTDDGVISNEFVARTLNVSKNGLLVEAHTCVEEGRQLKIMIGLENRTANLSGRVVRVEPATDDAVHIGLETEPSEESIGILTEYIDALQAVSLN